MVETCASIRVLVVDDDPTFLTLMGSFLSRLQCHFHLMQDSFQTLQFLRDNDVDICFMDIVMPQMGGVELTRVIKQDLGKTFPIVAVSAFYMTVDCEQCRQVGMADVLQKPVCFDDIKKVVLKYAPAR